MEPLKLVAKALGLESETPVDKVLDAISAVQKKAGEATTWEREAYDNLTKLEKTESLLKENAQLKAENFISKAIQDFQIDKAEAEVLKEMYMTGEDGEKAVVKLLATRKKADYFTRKVSLTAREVAVDPKAEVEAKAAELMAAEETFRGKPSTAQLEVLKRNPELAQRYREANVTGIQKGGER